VSQLFLFSMKRRQFIKNSAAVAASSFILPRFSIGQSVPAHKPLRLAVMGVGNITHAHALSWAGTASRRHIATLLCDVDQRRLDPINPMIHRPDISFAKCFPDAIRTTDYRTAFEQYGDEFDAVLCGSADHHHFGIAKLALEHGKPIYCEKPICWSPHEGFLLRLAAAEAKVATQMGNQGNSMNTWRIADAYYQHGHLGDITEVHGWIYSDGARDAAVKKFAEVGTAIPSELDWSKWCGAAGEHAYQNGIHPGQWRWWIPFGGGYIGDWGCHVFGGLFKTLGDFGYPSKVEIVKATEFNGDQFPKGMTVKWTFPARAGKPQMDMYFHTAHFDDPAFQPPRPDDLEADKSWPVSKHGCYWKGTKGTFLFNEGHNGSGLIIPDQKRRDIGRIEQLHPVIKGNSFLNHGDDWVAAVRGEKEWDNTVSSFEHGAYLSAVAQMGNSALRAGHAIDVDPQTGFPVKPEDVQHFTRQHPSEDWYGMMSHL
jgi:predicted dehydrogenase